MTQQRPLREPNELSNMLLRLYRMSQTLPITRLQDATLDLLREALPFDSAMWGTATNTPQGIDIHHIHLQNQPPDMLADYEAVKHLDTAAQAVSQYPRHVMGFNVEEWFHRRRQARLREYGARYKQANFFIASDLNPATQFVHWFTLFRSSERARCIHQECRLLQMLAPHVMQALTLNRITHLNRLEGPGIKGCGSAISDLHGVIYHADTGFEELLRREWTGWRGDRLPAALLDTFLQGQTRHVGHAAVVTGRPEEGLIFLGARCRSRIDDLTPHEHAVAELAARGLTHKEIARALARSPATVRNQIRSIYEKLEISHIAGMIAALRTADRL